MKKMIGVIPARAGSKRLPGKNKKIVDGKMLFEYSLIPALESNLDVVIITTDDLDIIERAQAYNNVKIIIDKRPEYLAEDGTTTEETIKYCIEKYKFTDDYICLLQPTNPTRTSVQINHSIKYFLQNKYQNLISVGPYEAGKQNKIIIDDNEYQINGTIYINLAKDIMNGAKMSQNTNYYIMDPVSSIDIDELSDFNRFAAYVRGDSKTEKIKLAYYTSTRADYGIVSQLLDSLHSHINFDLKLIISGTHLNTDYGETYQFINQEIPKIFIPITMEQSVEGVSVEIAETIVELTKIFQKEEFDYVVVLGDRYEAFAAITAARICNLKIVHIHGGEVTEGAVDEYLRHAMTKLSNIHFVTSEEYYQRVIQMGEQEESVHNIGSFSVENILTKDLSIENLSVDFDVNQEYYMMTYHAETLQSDEYNLQQFKIVLNTVLSTGRKVVLIKSNSDHVGALINNYIDSLNNSNICIFKSLPYIDNLILIKNARALVGNSSSGIIEVPYLKTPTINIGNRQGQRVKNPSRSIVNLEKAEDLTVELLLKNKEDYIYDFVFGNGHSIKKFIEIMQKIHKEQKITTIKKFSDIDMKYVCKCE